MLGALEWLLFLLVVLGHFVGWTKSIDIYKLLSDMAFVYCWFEVFFWAGICSRSMIDALDVWVMGQGI